MRSVLALLVMFLLAAPMAGAGHPNVACVQKQEIHTYFATVGALTFVTLPAEDQSFGVHTAFAQDACADATLAYDGDPETGFGGATFPAGTRLCLLPEEAPHHDYGPGAEYWATQATPGDLLYSAGADGPAFDPADPCATDGVLTEDPITDPWDCGAGLVGVYAKRWMPATLEENVLGSGACDPHDGRVWVFVMQGVFVDVHAGDVVVSTPTTGHVWSGDQFPGQE